jgi:hypothetical protein
MLLFLTDEDFDGRLTSALLARVPGLDLVRVQDVGLMHTPDILTWAAAAGSARHGTRIQEAAKHGFAGGESRFS